MPNHANINAVHADNRSKTRKGFGGIVKKSRETKVLNELIKRISLIRRAVPNHPIDGTLFEDLLAVSFEAAGCSVSSYAPHSPGADLNVDGKDISCKTGKIDENGILSFSGSRLQGSIKKGGIFEACDHLDRIDPDYFAFFISMKDELGGIYYKLIIIPGKSFLFRETEWEGFDENGFLIPDGRSTCKFTGRGISGLLKLSLSSQIWVDIDTSIHKPVFVQDIHPRIIKTK
jgi:hypothetical protein